MVSQFKALESDATLTLTKKNIMHAFTHRFAYIFQSTFVLAHSRSKRLVITRCKEFIYCLCNTFDFIVATHSCSFDCKHYLSHRLSLCRGLSSWCSSLYTGISARSSLRWNSNANPLEVVVDISVGNVWITGCTTVSIRSGKSLNMPSSLLSCVSSTCSDINSSSVSTFDS
ncbi:hypothetical protein H5410_003234, partial [Solanum commersonii]